MRGLQVLPNTAHLAGAQRLIAHLLHRIKNLPRGHFNRGQARVQFLVMQRFTQGVLIALAAHQRLLGRGHFPAGRSDEDIVADFAPCVRRKNSLQLFVSRQRAQRRRRGLPEVFLQARPTLVGRWDFERRRLCQNLSRLVQNQIFAKGALEVFSDHWALQLITLVQEGKLETQTDVTGQVSRILRPCQHCTR
ncbi:MAG: Uncharacterised protein [Pseudidiomarina mangrovi]|nr:MAG: Uncharacterised protein [Pseudidiomarina mangrovi]